MGKLPLNNRVWHRTSNKSQSNLCCGVFLKGCFSSYFVMMGKIAFCGGKRTKAVKTISDIATVVCVLYFYCMQI